MADDAYERLRQSRPEDRRRGPSPASFGPPGFYRGAVLAGVGLFGCVAVAVVIASVRTAHPPVLFTAAWVAALAWNAYWFLLRVCSRVSVDADGVRWATPLRSGVIDLDDVTRLGALPLGRGAQLLRSRSGPGLVIITRYGFQGLAESLQEWAPHADVRLPGWWSR
ncbi:hypothetical protein GCM10027047_30870 [Rhodococcus aerolatus]